MALIKNKSISNKKLETYQQSFVRINGWTLPLHWLQIIAWIFYLLMCLICFTIIVPTLPNFQIRCTIIVVKVVLLITHFITHVVAISINPADDNVVDKLNERKDKPFDRSKHSHVIENQFCYICETTVGPKSKHCSVCNKCVSNFDHHCKWLNNCVGGKNYRWFIYCVLSALIGTILVFINCLILTIAYFSENSWLYDKKSTLLFFNNESQFNQRLQIFWIITIITTLILSLIALLLLTHLLGFHLFLNCVGLSTYDFVVQQRKQKSNESASNELQTNKLVSYINRLQNCIGIDVCIKKRVKPFEINSNKDSYLKDKQLNASLFKHEKDIKQNEKIVQNSEDLEKMIEECAKLEVQTNNIKSNSPEFKSPQNSETTNPLNIKKESQFLSQFKEMIESEKLIDLKTNSNSLTIKESIDENDMTSEIEHNISKTPVRPKSTSQLYNENEPIFMPLNPSYGQNGRMSRLSFNERKDFIIPSTSPDFGLKYNLRSNSGLITPNRVFVGYNDYNKMIANNFRLNPLNQKLIKNNNLNINRFNRLGVESNNDLSLIQNNI